MLTYINIYNIITCLYEYIFSLSDRLFIFKATQVLGYLYIHTYIQIYVHYSKLKQIFHVYLIIYCGLSFSSFFFF